MRRRLRHGDDPDAPGFALRAEVREQLWERRVVGDDADRHAMVGDGGGDGIVVADVTHREDEPAAGGVICPQAPDVVGVDVGHQGGHGRRAGAPAVA